MKNLFKLIALFCFVQNVNAQCGSNVPSYNVDLSANPDTTWILTETEALPRQGQCCGVPENENCINFEVTLNANAGGIYFDFDGSNAYGSLKWRINCGTPYNLKATTCVNGMQTFTLTFCKAGGGNAGNYIIKSIPLPTFPNDQLVSLNCIQPLEILGVTAVSPTWQSISPGTPGQYNNLLSCTNCLTPTFTPTTNLPSEIEYLVCGYPILDFCVGYYNYCDTVKFTLLDSLQLSVSPNPAAFCTGGNVTLSAQATGGDGNYSYLWYNSSMQLVGTGPTYQASTYGSYTCEVRDGDYQPGLCAVYSAVNVIESLLPDITTSSNQVLCATSPNASISGAYQNAAGIIWSGGSGSFQNGNTSLNNVYIPSTADIANGNVMLTLTTTGVGGGCNNVSSQLQLFFIDTIKTNLINTALLCKNDLISVNPTISGGTAPFSFIWNNGITTLTNTLGEGSHCLTVNDANGCQITKCVFVTAPPSITLSASATPVSMNGGSDGIASVTVSGGVSPYTYLWSNGETSQTITDLSYGVYTVIVTDANGCVKIVSVVVNEPLCDNFFITVNPVDVSCFGGSNGEAIVSVSGGTEPFLFQWNDPLNQTNQNATNLSNGVYSVQVTDAVGCIVINTATINEPDQLTNTLIHTNVSVLGGNDGQAQANVAGGLGGYSYVWSNGETSASISNLISGWYTVVITDGNLCSLLDSVYISEPPCDQFYLMVNTTSPNCFGLNTGTANLSLINGQAPYSISWSTGETDVPSINGMAAGFHSVLVTDTRGCQLSQTFTISQPSQLSIGLSATNNTCFGINNGTIDASINGGTYPYFYNWNTGASTQDLVNLPSGTFSLTVIDNKGCQVFASAEVTQPQIFVVDNTAQNVSCYGFSDGSIDVEVSGGTAPYIYSWSNGSTNQDLSGIDEGGYILEITDANGCSPGNDLTVNIEQPEELSANTQVVSNYNGFGVSCFGMQNGEINVQITGGTLPYTCNWNNGDTIASISNLPAGNYSLVVTDANGCILGNAATITQPDSIAVSIQLANVSCNGGNDGFIDLSVNGGTQPYNYLWSTGDLTEDLAALTEGSYSLVLSDANGCLYTADQLVVHPNSLNISTQSIPATCNNLSNGSINLSCNGGTMPFQYQWSNGATSEDLSEIPNGSYQVIVTDANGCWSMITVEVTEPAPIVINGNVMNTTCYGDKDGMVDVTVTGGTTPYIFAWSNGIDQEDLIGFSSGYYVLTVVDANNCTENEGFTINQPNPLTVDLSSPVNFHQHNISFYEGNDGSIETVVTGGTAPFSYSWSNNNSSMSQSNLYAGFYILTVTDNNNCKAMDSIKLTQPDPLELPTVFTPNQDGDNDFFDIHGIDAYPNNELIIVNRWGNVVYEEERYHNTWKGTHKNGEELPDGVYFVILKINNNQIEKNTYVHIKRY